MINQEKKFHFERCPLVETLSKKVDKLDTFQVKRTKILSYFSPTKLKPSVL